MNLYENRISKVRDLMVKDSMDYLLVSDPTTVKYLTNIFVSPGERMFVLFISKDEKILFVNELFPVENNEIKKVTFKDTDDYVRLLSNEIRDNSKIGIDKYWPSKFLLKLMEYKNGKFINGSYIPDSLRMIKDEEEIRLMKEVSKINDNSIEMLVNEYIDETKTEEEVASDLFKVYIDNGANGHSFPPIIAFGKNGADPHHENDNSTLKPGDSIIIDIGCKKGDYNADMTRTYFYKEVCDEFREVYEVVKEAQSLAIKAVKPGARFKDVDDAARNYIEDKGYGKYFTHRTGHNIGMSVHEGDDVSSNNKNILKEGMIFSIEPGIYLPNKMGVRIEDLVLVTKDGCELLNNVSKELTIID